MSRALEKTYFLKLSLILAALQVLSKNDPGYDRTMPQTHILGEYSFFVVRAKSNPADLNSRHEFERRNSDFLQSNSGGARLSG